MRMSYSRKHNGLPLKLLLLSLIVAGTIIFLPAQTASDDGNNTPIDHQTETESNEQREEVALEEEYDYSQPVPATHAAADDFFRDAVFIGDSRTAGLQKLGGLTEATYYTAIGLKVDTIFTKEVVNTKDGSKKTIITALRQKPFKKVYIMLGINELGWAYSDLFIAKYEELIEEIKKIEPKAQIYVQSILPVSKKKSESDQIYNNAKIREYNQLIQKMAEKYSVYYLNVAECMLDQMGNLPEEASADGVHLNKKYCDLWIEYLRTHYVSEK
ncbi:MAG: hypothetical protein GX893_07905 [Firmicutes bacterium]|nr:hypothetical protein [Bacillota bacterium]